MIDESLKYFKVESKSLPDDLLKITFPRFELDSFVFGPNITEEKKQLHNKESLIFDEVIPESYQNFSIDGSKANPNKNPLSQKNFPLNLPKDPVLKKNSLCKNPNAFTFSLC